MPNILYRPRGRSPSGDSGFGFPDLSRHLVEVLPYATIAVIASQLPNIYYLATGRSAWRVYRADT